MESIPAASSTESPTPWAWRYQPLVPVTIALAAGIAVDRHFPLRASVWLLAVAAALIVWCALAAGHLRSPARRQLQAARVWGESLSLLVVFFGVGAAWHHVYWSVYPANDVGHWADRQTQPTRVVGEVIREPLVVRPTQRDPLRARPEETHTLSDVAVHAILTSAGWVRASGRAQLVVAGELTRVRAGDRVEVLGDLRAPPPAANPGEFSYRDYLRQRRTRAILRCDGPQCVRQVPGVRPALYQRPFERLAGAAERLLVERLPTGHSEIAVALLLGRYELLEEDVTELFMRTGTMHILAISGQHLAILAGFLWLVLRALPLSRKWGAVALGAIVIAYALLTGARPPVLRAAVLVSVLIGSIVLDRRARRANSLALALLIVLAVNPADLFDRGLQLSFLAVAALLWIVEPAWRRLCGRRDPLDQLVEAARPRWQRLVDRGVRWIVFAHVMSAVVWLANAPLLAARFHVFSPIVVPLTVLLVPIATVTLIAGLALLVVAAWWPGLGSVFAAVCGWGAGAMDWCVRIGSGVPGAYWYVPGPPSWWLAGFYAGMAAVLLFRPVGRVRWYWATATAAWLAVGLAPAALRPPPGELTCQVLAVGNGSAAVLQLPDGRVVLVDAGQIGGPRVGSRLIAPALWQAGITHIDAVFVTHADVDHFNGLVHLVERFAVGAVFVPPQFVRAEQPGVRVVLDELAARDIAVKLCWAGDRVELSRDVALRVLHPPPDAAGSHNEESLVLVVEYLGRRILLTGDVEGAGLARLLASDPLDVDVLIAPHHGSGRANPPELAAWARPEWVVVSQGKPRSGATLAAYWHAGIPVLSTNEHGAVTVCIDDAGVNVRTMR